MNRWMLTPALLSVAVAAYAAEEAPLPLPAVDRLIQEGIDPNAFLFADTAKEVAQRYADYKAGKETMRSYPWLPNLINAFLMQAPEATIAAVKELIAAGADVNAKNSYGEAAIFSAYVRRNAELCRVLLAAGAAFPRSLALHMAVFMHNIPACKVLIAANADLNAADEPAEEPDSPPGGFTPLKIAADQGDEEICRLLLAAGADPNIFTYPERRTPLMDAASAGHTEVCRILLEAGADINYQMSFGYGDNVLHVAARSAQADTLRVLLATKPNENVLNCQNRRGNTPLLEAVETAAETVALGKDASHYTETVRVLLSSGCETGITNIDDKTALDLAIENGLSDLEDLLTGEK